MSYEQISGYNELINQSTKLFSSFFIFYFLSFETWMNVMDMNVWSDVIQTRQKGCDTDVHLETC